MEPELGMKNTENYSDKNENSNEKFKLVSIFQSVAAPVFPTYCTGNIVQSYLNSTQNTTTPRCGKHHFDSHPRGFCLHENFKHGRQLRDQRGLLSTYSLRQIPNITGMNEWNLRAEFDPF